MKPLPESMLAELRDSYQAQKDITLNNHKLVIIHRNNWQRVAEYYGINIFGKKRNQFLNDFDKAHPGWRGVDFKLNSGITVLY